MAVSGELDLHSAPELEAALRRAITHGAPVVLDPRGLSFCDLSGSRTLEAIDRLAAENGQRFSVLRGSPVLDRLVALVPDASWPEFVGSPQGAPRRQPPTARSLDPTGTPASRLTRTAAPDAGIDLGHRAGVSLDTDYLRLSLDLGEAEGRGDGVQLEHIEAAEADDLVYGSVALEPEDPSLRPAVGELA